MKQSFGFGNGNLINVCPLDGHEVTWDYRTKMIDWMVEVCTTFKCTHRAYFLAVQIFDKVLLRMGMFGGDREIRKVL